MRLPCVLTAVQHAPGHGCSHASVECQGPLILDHQEGGVEDIPAPPRQLLPNLHHICTVALGEHELSAQGYCSQACCITSSHVTHAKKGSNSSSTAAGWGWPSRGQRL